MVGLRETDLTGFLQLRTLFFHSGRIVEFWKLTFLYFGSLIFWEYVSSNL